MQALACWRFCGILAFVFADLLGRLPRGWPQLAHLQFFATDFATFETDAFPAVCEDNLKNARHGPVGHTFGAVDQHSLRAVTALSGTLSVLSTGMLCKSSFWLCMPCMPCTTFVLSMGALFRLLASCGSSSVALSPAAPLASLPSAQYRSPLVSHTPPEVGMLAHRICHTS